jgi:hypothetical protein
MTNGEIKPEHKTPRDGQQAVYDDVDKQRRHECFMRILLETAEELDRNPQTYAQFLALTKRKT